MDFIFALILLVLNTIQYNKVRIFNIKVKMTLVVMNLSQMNLLLNHRFRVLFFIAEGIKKAPQSSRPVESENGNAEEIWGKCWKHVWEESLERFDLLHFVKFPTHTTEWLKGSFYWNLLSSGLVGFAPTFNISRIYIQSKIFNLMKFGQTQG